MFVVGFICFHPFPGELVLKRPLSFPLWFQIICVHFSLKKHTACKLYSVSTSRFFNIRMLCLFIIFNFQCICCLLMFCRTEISVIQSQFLEAFHNSFISLNLAIKQHILEDIRKELREYYNAMVSFMIDFYSQLHLILLRNMAIPHILLFTMLLIFELATLFSFFLFLYA